MKLSQLLAGATALAFAAGVAGSTFADPAPSTTNIPFSLTGSVVSSCLLSFSSTTATIGNGGQIAIDTTATDTTNYFHMTNTNEFSNTLRGAAGCNTANTVSVVKTNGTTGLQDNNTSKFDSSVLQNTLPYSLQFGFDHGASGDPVSATAGSAVIPNNEAFSGEADLTITVPQAPKGLLSGTYTDTVTVTLTAAA